MTLGPQGGSGCNADARHQPLLVSNFPNAFSSIGDAHMPKAHAHPRNVVLSALVALTLLLGVLLVIASNAHAGYDSCAATKVCLYPQNFGGGQPSVFNGEDVGCKTHDGLNPLSIYNNTGNKYVTIPGQALTILPGQTAEFGQSVTGLICITTN
jgi:hypothetical protein